MKESKTERQEMQEQSAWSVLEELARKGARKMLAKAMELEVTEFTEKHQDKVDEDGHRLVVRNGYMDEREIITGIGPWYPQCYLTILFRINWPICATLSVPLS